MHFSTDFGWYSIHLGIVHLEQGGGGGGGGGCLNKQNLLISMTKVICQQSPRMRQKSFTYNWDFIFQIAAF